MEQESYYGNVNETNNNDYLIERQEVEHTPFTLVKHENLWYTLLGKYRLSEGSEHKLIELQKAKEMTWERIMQVIAIMITENDINPINK